MDAPELLPCPFCGGKAEIWKASGERTAWISCMGRCSVLVSKEYKTDAEAIAAWNTRTDRANELVAAACEGLINQAVGMADGRDEARYIEDRMRDAIPTDAVAALAARDARVREAALREAADICTNVIKNYDVMEPGKPDQYANLKMQKAAKGMVSLVRQDIEALIAKDKANG